MTAWRWQVDYSLELGPPIVTLQDARKQNSFHKLPALPGPNTNLPSGEKSAIPHVQKCPMQIRGAKWQIPTQVLMLHMPCWHCRAFADITYLNAPQPPCRRVFVQICIRPLLCTEPGPLAAQDVLSTRRRAGAHVHGAADCGGQVG